MKSVKTRCQMYACLFTGIILLILHVEEDWKLIRDAKADLDRVKQAMLHNVGGAIEMKLHQI